MKLKNFLLALIFLIPLYGFGQNSNLGNWMIIFGNKQFTPKINWHHEVQYRNYNAAGDLEQLLLRTGIGTKIGENSNLLMGYGFIRSENYIPQVEDKEVVNEHRIYQQFITTGKVNKLRLQHRYRFEQRFVEEDFKLRWRYFLSANYPIAVDAAKGTEFYLSAYNEIFIGTKGNFFDRNRLYGGLGYRLNANLRFELGYMNQFLGERNRDQLNLVCFINW